jgi:hypothetical protein
MLIPFLILYPSAIYLLRSPRTSAAGTAFNYHWTLNSLASIFVSIGAFVGYYNSHSISIVHQYIGILIVGGLAVQTVLGWRHHVVYLAKGGRTWMAGVHKVLGRVILPMGMLNVISGLLLREYGWIIVGLTIGVAAAEVVVLCLIVFQAQRRRPAAVVTGKGASQGVGLDEAEEYFQLAGDDDDDEFSDDEAGEEERRKREAEKEEKAKRLAKLDRV